MESEWRPVVPPSLYMQQRLSSLGTARQFRQTVEKQKYAYAQTLSHDTHNFRRDRAATEGRKLRPLCTDSLNFFPPPSRSHLA
jgi:hypothetical protein